MKEPEYVKEQKSSDVGFTKREDSEDDNIRNASYRISITKQIGL